MDQNWNVTQKVSLGKILETRMALKKEKKEAFAWQQLCLCVGCFFGSSDGYVSYFTVDFSCSEVSPGEWEVKLQKAHSSLDAVKISFVQVHPYHLPCVDFFWYFFKRQPNYCSINKVQLFNSKTCEIIWGGKWDCFFFPPQSQAPPDLYLMTKNPADSPNDPDVLEMEFRNG